MTSEAVVVGSRTAEAFADRVFSAGLGMIDVLTIYLGGRLGYYTSLASDGPASPSELAQRTDTNLRYTREWLEQGAVSGILAVDRLDGPADERRYSLPEEHAEVLTCPDSLFAMAWLPRLLVGCARRVDDIAVAFRTGGGVPWASYGEDVIEGQGDQNRPVFEQLLVREWLPLMPDVHERLRSGRARIADVCCGVGVSSIALAKHFPNVVVDGFDLDPASVEIARSAAWEVGLADRVSFEAREAADLTGTGPYDVAFVFESVHDLARPVEVLGSIRRVLAPDGVLVVMDERVAESFVAPGDDVERLMYGYSVLLCLPASMVEQPSAATGTVMRPSTMVRYAQEAGFRSVDVAAIEHPFFRLYVLK